MKVLFYLPPALGRMVLATLLGGLITGMAAGHALAEPLDRIVAVAGEDIILASELESAEQEITRQLRSQGASVPPADDLRRQVLERLIITRLQTSRATRSGIEVSDADIDNALKTVAQRNNMDQEQFRTALANEGISYKFYRQQLHDELLINHLRQKEVDSRVTVTDRDIDLFLQAQNKDNGQQYRLRQILVALPPGSDSETRKAARSKAENILEQLREGAEFIGLAQSESDGQQALEGGDLGWVEGNLLPTVFADVVPALQPGEISGVVSSDSGFHIVRLDDVRTAGKRLVTREVHARHILLRPNEIRDAERTEALIRDIHQQLAEGAEFAELARKYSDDPGSASEGGDLGWQETGTFDPAFRDVLHSLETGTLSEPFRSDFGWHIAEVLEWRERDRTVDQRRAQARNLLMQRRVNEEYERWLRRLRGDAYVEYRLPGFEDKPTSEGG